MIAASLQTSVAGSAGNSQQPEVNFLLIRTQSILACPSLGISRQFGLAEQRAEGGSRHPVTWLSGDSWSLLLQESFFNRDMANLINRSFSGCIKAIPAHCSFCCLTRLWKSEPAATNPIHFSQAGFIFNRWGGRKNQERQAGKTIRKTNKEKREWEWVLHIHTFK